MKRFCLAAVPTIGFVHGAFERRPRNGCLVERQDVCQRAKNQRGRLPDLLDYGTAAFVIMALAFGPVLTWLMFA